ncbi:MAG: hypothetical protein ABI045_01980 [Flavobacteriales bacterium]
MVQLKKDVRHLQWKNIIRVKFDKIMQPLIKALIDQSQQKHINFEAFLTILYISQD